MISELFLSRTSHFSKVLSQYCRVVKTYKPIWLYRTRNDMYADHTPKLFRKRPQIKKYGPE